MIIYPQLLLKFNTKEEFMATDGFTKLNPDTLCEQTKKLENFLSEKIISQPRAIKCVVSAYDKFNSLLWQTGKPILSALFLGPSGVGKTYIAEILAEYFFDNPAAFTKIECANYVERQEISKLLGAPPGYIGYNEMPLLSQNNIELPAIQHAQLTLVKTDKEARRLSKEMEKIRQKYMKSTSQLEANSLMRDYTQKVNQFQNYFFKKTKDVPVISIILFDEIEKAHSSLHHFLLEVTSKGKTRLGNGEETLFCNSFIIMTSNVGSRSIAEIVKGKKEIGFIKGKRLNSGEDEIYTRAILELKKIFSTEFLGRIKKDIIVFENLNRSDVKKIIDIQLRDALSSLAKTFPIELTVSGEAKDLILEKSGDHPEYGARLISDKIDKYIREPLSRMINSGQILKNDKISVNLENGNIVFLKDNSAIA